MSKFLTELRYFANIPQMDRSSTFLSPDFIQSRTSEGKRAVWLRKRVPGNDRVNESAAGLVQYSSHRQEAPNSLTKHPIRIATATLLSACLFLATGKAEDKSPPPGAGSLTGEMGSVSLVLEDATGFAHPQRALIYDGASADWTTPLATSATAEEAIAIAPGTYWVVSAVDELQSDLVTLGAGETKEVRLKVERGLWITVQNPDWITAQDPDAKTSEKQLLVLRPKAEMEQWLKDSRKGLDYSIAALRPDATKEAIEDARKKALTALPWLLEEPPEAQAELTAEEKRAWYGPRQIELEPAQRILAVAGEPEDVEALIKLLKRDSRPSWHERLVLLIGYIEARNDVLENGRLIAMLGDEDWGLDAAKTLHQFGLPVGREVLRRWLVPAEDGVAQWLSEDASLETLQAMRAFVRDDVFKEGRPPLDACIYLLTHGDLEDWKLVASLPIMSYSVSSYLAPGMAQDPRTLIPNGTVAIQEMRDRSDFEELRDWLNHTVIVQEPDPNATYESRMNTIVVRQSDFYPDARAVLFYRGFSGSTPVSSLLTSGGYLGPSMTWFPYPESLDLFVQEWMAGKTRYLPQLDYVDSSALEDAVKRIGAGQVPPGYEMFLAYHRIAHRQRYIWDPFPRDERRWPYLFAYREKDASGGEHFGGGISGVASLKADLRESTLVLRLKLDQRPHYEQANSIAGIGNRETLTEYPHHHYTLEAGRPLIDHVAARRGFRRFVASNIEIGEDGWMVFEATLDSPSLKDLWVDVNLKCLDETITLTESLSFGIPATRLRQARYENAQSLR